MLFVFNMFVYHDIEKHHNDFRRQSVPLSPDQSTVDQIRKPTNVEHKYDTAKLDFHSVDDGSFLVGKLWQALGDKRLHLPTWVITLSSIHMISMCCVEESADNDLSRIQILDCPHCITMS